MPDDAPPKPMEQANAEFQQHLDQQAATERGKAYFAAHPEQYQAQPSPEAEPAREQKVADITGSESGGDVAAGPALGKSLDVMSQPGANVVKPAMTAMGMPRAGGTIASAIDYYMWPPQAIGDLARKAGMAEPHATLLQHAVAGAYITLTGYGALRAGKEAAEGVAGAIKSSPESELGADAPAGGPASGSPPQPTEAPLAVGPGQATRLYRAEGKVQGDVPGWVKEQLAGTSQEAASGRWFTQDPKIAQEYLNNYMDPEKGHITSVDVPNDQLEQHRVSNQPDEVKRFSRDPENEFFLPKELAEQRKPVGEGEGAAGDAEGAGAKKATEVPHTMPEAIAEATRTPFTKEQVMALKQTLAGPEVGHEMPATPLDAIDNIRMHRYATDQAAKVIDAYRTGDMETATDEIKHLIDDVRPVYLGAAHAAGYGLRVYGKPVSEDVPMLKDVWGAIENANGGYDQMVKAMASLPDAGTARKFAEMTAQMAASTDPGMIGNMAHGIANYYTHALLSVNTVAKKAATDSFMMLFGIGQSYVGEGLSDIAGAMGSQNTLAPGRATKGVMGFMGAASDAFQIGWKAMKENVSQLDPSIWGPAGYHDPSEGSLSGVNIPILGPALGWYGKVVDLPSRGILGVDNFAKVMQQRRMLHEFAWQEGYDQASRAGLEGEEFANAVQAGYGKLIDRPSADIMARSIQEARRLTMTAPLTDYGLGALGKMASAIRGTAPGQMLIPFFNTPVNLAMQGTEFAGPLGLASKVMRDQLLSDTPERFTALAKLGVTTLFWAAMWDHLHGSSPDNPQIKKLTEGEEGHQPYSLTVGNHEVGNIAAPEDNALAYMAEAKEILGRIDGNNPDGMGVATAISLALMRQLDTSSSMQNLSGLVNLLSTGAKQLSASEIANQRAAEETPESVEAQETPQGIRQVANAEGKRQLIKFVGSFIPSTAADIAHGIDPIHRDVKNYLDEVKSRTPGLSSSIKPDVDLFGHDVKTPMGWNRVTGNTISLFRTTEIKNDPVIGMLAKLNPSVAAIGHDGTLSVGPSGAIEKVPATDAQIYQAQKLRGVLKDPTTGLNLKDYLKSMMDDPQFKRAPSDTQLKKVTRVITGFTRAAIGATMDQNQDLQQRYAGMRALRVQRGGSVSGANPLQPTEQPTMAAQ